jgi:hypothetical protein
MNHPVNELLALKHKTEQELALLAAIVTLSVREGFQTLTKEQIYDALLIEGRAMFPNE